MKKKSIGTLWSALYVKPKNWLCGLQSDKLLHFIVSMILVLLLFAASESLLVAMGVTFIIGVLKEVLIDKFMNQGTADIDDVLADLLGLCVGVVLLWLMGLVDINLSLLW